MSQIAPEQTRAARFLFPEQNAQKITDNRKAAALENQLKRTVFILTNCGLIEAVKVTK